MKIIVSHVAVLIFLSNLLIAQTLVVDSRFGATYTHEQGDMIMTSTLGPPIPSTDYQNNLAVLTDHINLPSTPDTTNTQDPLPLKGIRVFPNPTPDILLLSRENWDEDYSVKVYSTVGQTLRQMNWDKGIQSFQFSFKDLPSGIYLVTISNSSTTMRTTYKIQKR